MNIDQTTQRIRSTVRDIPDFPKPGIIFKDIHPVLEDGGLFAEIIDLFAERYRPMNLDRVVGIDARGFIFAGALAIKLGMGLALVRKKGKLPFKTIEKSYDLEYGSNTIEMHHDALKPGQRVVVLDDVLATGGTMKASCDLVRQLGAEVVECGCLIELSFLGGKKVIEPAPFYAPVVY